MYYDLDDGRKAADAKDVAICRVEQLCPFPYDLIQRELKRYPSKYLVNLQLATNNNNENDNIIIKKMVWCIRDFRHKLTSVKLNSSITSFYVLFFSFTPLFFSFSWSPISLSLPFFIFFCVQSFLLLYLFLFLLVLSLCFSIQLFSFVLLLNFSLSRYLLIPFHLSPLFSLFHSLLLSPPPSLDPLHPPVALPLFLALCSPLSSCDFL